MSSELESYLAYCENENIVPTIPSFISFSMENDFVAEPEDLKWLARFSEGKLADFALSNKSTPNMKIAFLQKYLDKYCGYKNESKQDIVVPVNISLTSEENQNSEKIIEKLQSDNITRETGKKEFNAILDEYVKAEKQNLAKPNDERKKN